MKRGFSVLSLVKIYLISAGLSLAQVISLIESTFVNRRIKPPAPHSSPLVGEGRVRGSSRGVNLLRLSFKAIAWIHMSISFILRYNKESMENCLRLFNDCLVPGKINDVAVFGINDIAKIIVLIANERGIKIAGVYDNVGGIRFSGYTVSHYTDLKGYPGKVIVSSPFNTEEKVKKLEELGIKKENIKCLRYP